MAFDPTFLAPLFDRFWMKDRLDIYRREDYVDEETCTTQQRSVLVAENLRCKVSKRKYNPQPIQTVGPNDEDFVVTVFVNPQYDMQTGDYIKVREISGGRITKEYQGYTGTARPYANQIGFDLHEQEHA